MVIFGGRLSDAKKRAPNQVPLFLEKSLLYVEQHVGVDCEGIFRVSGSLENIKRIKEAIERGAGDVDYEKTPVRDAHEVAGIIKLYFRELAEPLVPAALMKDFVKVGANENNSLNESSVTALLGRLPPDNFAVMKRLMLFLKKLSEYAATTKMTADNLALVFSPNLLRDASTGIQEMMWSGHISAVVCFMITRASSLFPDTSGPPKPAPGSGFQAGVPPPVKRPPSVTSRKNLSALDLSNYTIKGDFRVGMSHNLPAPPACLQGCNWGPLTQTGKVAVYSSNESSSVIVIVTSDEGRMLAQGIPANVMDTTDSSRYFVIPRATNPIIVPGQESGISYIGVALYTPEDSMSFRALVDNYRPQEFITHKPSQNGAFVLNNAGGGPTTHPRSATNAPHPNPPIRPPFRKPVAPTSAIEKYTPGTPYRKIINMALDDEELIVYERIVQLSYANVFRCSMGPLCCMVKIFAKPDDKIIQYTLQEHSNKLKHPNLLRSLGSQFEENIFCTFYEYCGNNSVWELMYRHKVEENPLAYRDIKHYASMVAKALAYLHENNTPHRDIKSCNVFLDGDEEPFQVVKLGDVCSSLSLNIQWPIMYTSTFPYTPPEVLEDSAKLQNNADAFKVDVWQFGMFLVELETLGMPFEGMSEDDTQSSILSGRLPPSLPPSSPFYPLIQQCLKVNPADRLSADQIVLHLSKLAV